MLDIKEHALFVKREEVEEIKQEIRSSGEII